MPMPPRESTTMSVMAVRVKYLLSFSFTISEKLAIVEFRKPILKLCMIYTHPHLVCMAGSKIFMYDS